MYKILFDKIQSAIGLQNEMEVHFHFNHGACDIVFEKPFLNNDELSDLLSGWFLEEMKDKLVELDAYADSIHITFKQQNNKLLAQLTLRCSDEDFEYNERHSKDEILKDELLTILSAQIDNFDNLHLDFSFSYNTRFENFDIYYENELLVLDPIDVETIKGQIEKIILQWPGMFRGKNALKVNKFVEIDLGDYFHCYDFVLYEFEF